MGFFSKGLKNEFETAMVNKPLVFEPLKFYCIELKTDIPCCPIKMCKTLTMCEKVAYVQVEDSSHSAHLCSLIFYIPIYSLKC